MPTEQAFQYTHVEAGLVENVAIRRTDDLETYPSGWKYTLHLGTIEDLTLVHYDNAHEETKGYELHTAAGAVDEIEFPGMEARLVEFWASADEYWEAIDAGRIGRTNDHHRYQTMTTLHITVGDREQLREDALQFVQEAEADTRSGLDGESVIQFGSYDDLVDSLTPLRLELIQAIAVEGPQSMREAARLVDRDVSDVHSDLKRLEVLGILTLEEGGAGGAMEPVVPFDRIEMHIDYPLVGDIDSTAASA